MTQLSQQEHQHWQIAGRDDPLAQQAYLDRLEEDGQYELLVRMYRTGLTPRWSAAKRKFLAAGTGVFPGDGICCFLPTLGRVPLGVREVPGRWKDPRRPDYILTTMLFNSTATSRYLRGKVDALVAVIDRGLSHPSDRRAAAVVVARLERDMSSFAQAVSWSIYSRWMSLLNRPEKEEILAQAEQLAAMHLLLFPMLHQGERSSRVWMDFLNSFGA